MSKKLQYLIGLALVVSFLTSACSVLGGGTQLPPVGVSSTPTGSTISVTAVGTYVPATKTSADATFEAYLTQEAATANAMSTQGQANLNVQATALALTNNMVATSQAKNTQLVAQLTQAVPTSTQVPAATSTPIAQATDVTTSTVTGNSLEQLLNSSYMLNYAKTLSYSVPVSMQVSKSLLNGFLPVSSLVMTNTVYPNGYKVKVSDAPQDVVPYSCFPQDYAASDLFNPGCQEMQKNGLLPWKNAIASYREGDNWNCVDVNGWCADAVDSFNWIMWNGQTVCHPAVGCLQNPNPKGAVSLMIVNLNDSDEAWDVRNNSGVYVTAGWAGFGKMFDLSGGKYNVGDGIAAIRNHFLWQLAFNEANAGQCGDSHLCKSVLYVVVARIWDRPELGIKYAHYELLSAGVWNR